MIEELKYHLQQGATTVKELVRLTGRTDSGIRKAIANIAGVVEGKDSEGRKTFALPVGDEPKKTEAAKPLAAPAEPVAAPAEPTGKRGRKASFAGRKLFHLVKQGETEQTLNPRRKGSHGFKSLQIIIDNPGLTTEQFVEKGGRLNDLRWDVAHGNVKAE